MNTDCKTLDWVITEQAEALCVFVESQTGRNSVALPRGRTVSQRAHKALLHGDALRPVAVVVERRCRQTNARGGLISGCYQMTDGLIYPGVHAKVMSWVSTTVEDPSGGVFQEHSAGSPAVISVESC